MVHLHNFNFLAFRVPIYNSLQKNLSLKTCETLANMLAIDFVQRLNKQEDMEKYIEGCITKLQKFLQLKVMPDDDFSICMLLFSVAIAPEAIDYQEKKNILNKEQTQDQLIETILGLYFSDNQSSEIHAKIRETLKILLNGKDGLEILNSIISDPKLVVMTIKNAVNQFQKDIEINNHIKNTITRLSQKTIKLNKQIDFAKQIGSKTLTTAASMAILSAELLVSGALLPVTILPSVLAIVKYTPKFGEKIAQKFSNLNTKSLQSKIDEIKLEVKRTDAQLGQQIQSKNQNLANLKDQAIDKFKEQMDKYKAPEEQNIMQIKKGERRIYSSDVTNWRGK